MKEFAFLFSLFIVTSVLHAQNEVWPQFRGLNGAGVAAEDSRPPVTLSEKNLLWKTGLPFGVSSPVIWNDRIFLTGFTDSTKELLTLCLDRKLGNILWKNAVIPDTVEKYHSIASPAQGTVTTDGERVVAYFGSCGLVCYDVEGRLLWRYRVACNRLTYGHATSPVISGDKVIYFNDAGPKRFLVALNKFTGMPVWRKDFPSPNVKGIPVSSSGGHAVPCIYQDKILLNRVGGVSGYSLIDGSPVFDYPAMSAGNATPFVYKNGVIATTWFNFSEESQRGNLPSFDELLTHDKNRNGTIDRMEIPDDIIFYQRPGMELDGSGGLLRNFVWIFDTGKDKEISREEWDAGLKLLNDVCYKPAGLISVGLDNRGELNDSAVVWRVPDNIPEVPSPLLYKNRIYMVKEGGILTCVDPETGKVMYVNKLGAPGAIMASPVAANGFVYFLSHNGRMKVVKAGDRFEIAGEYDFKEKIGATPAIVGNNLYVRAGKYLMAFGK